MYLYKREDMPDYETTKEVKWIRLKRIMNHSSDLSEFSIYNYLYSPNLEYYLDSDNSGDCFMIRRIIDRSILLKFPTGILNPKTDSPKDIVRKFKWTSNSEFKMINNDDFEKLFQIYDENKIRMIGYGRVPMLGI